MTTQAKTNKTTKANTAKAQAAKVEAFQETVETAAKASQDAMQDGFEKAVASAGEFGTHVKANTEALVESLTIAGKGVEAINTEATTFAKTTLENGVATAQAFAGAKSLQEMVELQTNFAKSTMDAYLGELTTLTGLTTGLVKDTTKPINDRAQLVVELVQNQN